MLNRSLTFRTSCPNTHNSQIHTQSQVDLVHIGSELTVCSWTSELTFLSLGFLIFKRGCNAEAPGLELAPGFGILEEPPGPEG